jgi:hypothetical protein
MPFRVELLIEFDQGGLYLAYCLAEEHTTFLSIGKIYIEHSPEQLIIVNVIIINSSSSKNNNIIIISGKTAFFDPLSSLDDSTRFISNWTIIF